MDSLQRTVEVPIMAMLLLLGCGAHVADEGDETEAVAVTSAALTTDKEDRTITETQDMGADPSRAVPPEVEITEGDFGSSTASSGVERQATK